MGQRNVSFHEKHGNKTKAWLEEHWGTWKNNVLKVKSKKIAYI
jgi:hypothetical protein